MLHGHYPASQLLWAFPTPCWAAPRLCIPAARWSLALPPDRASQAPRLIFPRALSPTTPEGPMVAYACYFTTGLVWLHPSRADWPPSYSYRGRIGSLALRLACSPHESLPAPLLEPTLARLRAEQAIYTVNSFQFTRSARLILAYPTNGRRHTASSVSFSKEGFCFLPSSHRSIALLPFAL